MQMELIQTKLPFEFENDPNLYIGGIPNSVFSDSFEGNQVRGQSGLLYRAEINRTLVNITYINNPNYAFEISLCGDQLRASIQTRHNGIVSPDLYASKLFSRSVEHFKAQGLDINSFCANWSPGCTNYEQNERLRGTYGSQAPFFTWTGRMVRETLGFDSYICNGTFYQEDENNRPTNDFSEYRIFRSSENMAKLPGYMTFFHEPVYFDPNYKTYEYR